MNKDNRVQILKRTKLVESIVEKQGLSLRRFPVSSRAVKMFLEEVAPKTKLQESTMVSGGIKYMPISGGLYDVFTNKGQYITTDICRKVESAKSSNGMGGNAIFEEGSFAIDGHYFRQIAGY